MHLQPYECVDGLPFSTSLREVRARCGLPDREAPNAVGLLELDYGHVVYRFQASGRLEEVTKPTAVLHLGTLAVPYPALEHFIRQHDADAFLRAGHLVSPALGLAYVPGQPPWVTALARQGLDSWRALPQAG